MVLRPQTTVDIKSNLSLISPPGDGVIAIIGTAQWGPLDEVKTITSFNEALEYYKDDSSSVTLTLIKGLDLAYRNGAGTVKVLRIEDGTAASSEITLTSGSTDVITIYGKYKGTYGDNIQVTVTANGSNKDVSITDGVKTESYTNGGSGYDSNLDIVTAINAASALTIATSLNNTYLVDAATATNLSSGNDGESFTAANVTTGYDNYLNTEDFNFLVVPGTTADSFHTTMVAKMNTRETNDDKFSVFIGGVAENETIATIGARTASGKRLSIVAPSIKYTSRITGVAGYLDGSYLSCAYAGVLAGLWVAESPTHKTINIEGVYKDTANLKQYYNNGEQEQLLEKGITPIAKLANTIGIIRGVTKNSSTTEVWYEQNIVNIVDYVRSQVLEQVSPFIGQLNLSRVRNTMAKIIDGVLLADKLAEIIEDYETTTVEVGSSSDTVNIGITVKPAFAINFINVNLTVDNVSS